MAVKNGTAFKVYLAGTVIGQLVSNGVSFKHSPRETTSKDSAGAKTVAEGLTEWSMDATARFDYAETLGPVALFAYIKGRTELAIKSETTITGEYEWNGQCYITSWDVKSESEGSMEISISLQGTGVLTCTVNA